MSYQGDNAPIASSQNAPVALLRQWGFPSNNHPTKRRYTKAKDIEALAVSKYKRNGNGLTFDDLLLRRAANHKEQAQQTLKRCLESNILFTISSHKPQRYYPTCLRAEVLKHEMSKNAPIGVTEVNPFSKANLMSLESPIIQSLEGYVLPLLPSTPLHIHKIQFRLKVSPECYSELNLPIGKGNNGKLHEEVIGRVRVSYYFYANGTVMVFTESSNNPFKLENETDRSRLMVSFGQIRDRLVTFLQDKHERIVPDIMEWDLTQCDINKDVRISDWLQITGLKIQVKHFDHLFRVYIKSIGKDTVCRIEQSLNLGKKPAVEAINEIFSNPDVKSQQSFHVDYTTKISEIYDMVSTLLNLHKHDPDAAVVQSHDQFFPAESE